MSLFVCPSCGYTSNAPQMQSDNVAKCKKCGHTVALDGNVSARALQSGKRRQSAKRKSTATKLIAAGSVVVVAIVLVAVLSRDSTPAKTQLFELNKDEVDAKIESVGITALEGEGWSESDTAFYIETRLAEYKTLNETARASVRSSVTGGNSLKLKSTASDIATLGTAERRKANEEIQERDLRIKQFEQILADYRQSR